MNFEDTPEEAQFRAEAKHWLADAVPELWATVGQPATWATESQQLAAAKAWQARKFDAGYAAITRPREMGGRDGRSIHAVIFRQEEAHYRIAGGELNIGLGMCIPIVDTFGSPEHRERYVRKGLRGEEV